MIEACKIPENILKNMTTEALFETMMNYPLLSDMLFYDDKDLGYKIMKENCSLFNELFSRSDVKEVFELYASSELYTCSSAIPFEEQIKLTCFNIIYNSEFEESYQIMSAGEVTNSNVKTPNGTKVPHIEGLTFNGHGYYGTTEDLDKEMKKRDIQKVNAAIDILYEDWKKEYIDYEQYCRLKLKYEMQIKQIEQSIQNNLKNNDTIQKELEEKVCQGMEELQKKQKEYSKWSAYYSLDVLSREMAEAFISKVVIDNQKNISIFWMFSRE